MWLLLSLPSISPLVLFSGSSEATTVLVQHACSTGDCTVVGEIGLSIQFISRLMGLNRGMKGSREVRKENSSLEIPFWG